jgi:hypothetical protein
MRHSRLLLAAATAAALLVPSTAMASADTSTIVKIDGTCWIGDPEGNVDVPVVYVADKRVTPGRPICN